MTNWITVGDALQELYSATQRLERMLEKEFSSVVQARLCSDGRAASMLLNAGHLRCLHVSPGFFGG